MSASSRAKQRLSQRRSLRLRRAALRMWACRARAVVEAGELAVLARQLSSFLRSEAQRRRRRHSFDAWSEAARRFGQAKSWRAMTTELAARRQHQMAESLWRRWRSRWSETNQLSLAARSLHVRSSLFLVVRHWRRACAGKAELWTRSIRGHKRTLLELRQAAWHAWRLVTNTTRHIAAALAARATRECRECMRSWQKLKQRSRSCPARL